MTTIAQAELESRLSEILRRSADGETFEITRDGQPVVRMSPATTINPKKDPARARAAAERLIELSNEIRQNAAEREKFDRNAAEKAVEELIAMRGFAGKATADEIKAMVHEGHRY